MFTRNLRSIIATGAIATMMFPVLALAVDDLSAASNANTGANSATASEVNSGTSTAVVNTNNATTYNNAVLLAETGGNNASYNTRSGIITTDKAEGRGEMVNLINNNVVNVLPASIPNATASNQNTGADSVNLSTVNITNETLVRNINTSNTVNRVQADVISGRNLANANTGHGIILSGQADLGLNFLALANTNFTNVQNLYADTQNIFGNHSGNLDFNRATISNPRVREALLRITNKNTGAGSTNTSTVNIDNQTIISNSNTGRLENHITANVVSGQNHANQNTGTGSVASGDAKASVNVMNFLNANITASNFWLKSLNVFGNWSGNINLPKMPAPNLRISTYVPAEGTNTVTGSNSENSASVQVTDETSQTNDNTADITNDFSVKANTGNNVASFNNGSGAVKFGNAKAEINTANVANVNITGDAWWVLVINRFGNWQGTTIGSPADMIVNSGQNSTVLSPVNSGIEVFNDTTGSDSNNTAGASINHATQLSNTNDASINNDISVAAISGENETQYNAGHGYIEVGNVTSAVNAMNIANVNVNAGNVLIAMVNVFGDWSGNVVFNAGASPLQSHRFIQINPSASASNGGLSNLNGATNVTNQNTTNTTNNTSAASSTGQNSANFNTGSGIVSTGSADTASNLLNQSNNNQVTAGNASCGNSSAENTATVSADCITEINNQNTAQNTSNVIVNNSTGNNIASYNTGNGVVDTSWVDTFVELYNQNNENHVTVGQVEQIIENPEPNPSLPPDPTPAPAPNPALPPTPPPAPAPAPNPSPSPSPTPTPTPTPIPTPTPAPTPTSMPASSTNSAGASNAASNTNANACANKPRGDINCDGKVDIYDLSIMLSNWSKRFKEAKADVSKDGRVDFYDLSIIMANWTKKVTVAKSQ